MANTTVKGKFNVVAENGDVQTIYPKTTGDQVLVDRSSNASVIPNDVANLQHIVNKMGSLALKSKVETSDFTTGTMINSIADLKSNTETGKIADATVVKDIESRVDTLENSNLVTVDELDAGLATKPDTEINDSVTSTSLTWSSKKLSDQLTTLNSNTSLLDTRVNTLITHNNDTEGNSELIDIRTGADGMTYASAGNAVRIPLQKLRADFESVAVVTADNTFVDIDFDNMVDDKYMSKNGTEGTQIGGCYGAITVHTGEKYKIKAEVGTNIRTYVIKNASGTVTRFPDAETFNTKHNYNVEITITSDEDGGTLFVSTIHADYIGLKKVSRVYMIDKDKIEDFPINPLYGKTALFNGDSICAGLSVGSSDPTYGYGWAGRIGIKNNMTWRNYGVSGGTVTTDTYNWTSVPASDIDYSSGNKYYRRVGSSASGTDTMYVEVTESQWDGTSSLYSRGKARYWESTSIDTLYSEYPDADYIILEACLNDGFNGVPKGTVTNDNFSPSSTTTFASAMEYMINRAITLFPNAKIGVIIPHRVNDSSMNNYYEIARSACEKWGIPYIDLYKQSGLCVKNPIQKAVMFAVNDNTHLTAAGYDMITDKIEAWMKTL